jgi:hypothetical protein
MKPLTEEQYRILHKRIAKAIYKAKYTPMTVIGVDGHDRAAAEVLEPYRPRPAHNEEPKT